MDTLFGGPVCVIASMAAKTCRTMIISNFQLEPITCTSLNSYAIYLPHIATSCAGMWFYRLYSCKIKYLCQRLHREPREHVLAAIDATSCMARKTHAGPPYMVYIDRHVVLSL